MTIKKGALGNVIFPMVDSTDFASIESGITASDFNSAATRQYIGYNIGSSATAAFSSLSKTTNLVTSGIFHHVLNETETDFDVIMLRFTHPSCADQLLVFFPEDYTHSDVYSQLSDIGSNLLSYLTGISGMVSDVDSQVLLNASMISDTQSALDSQYLVILSNLSDVESQVDLLATSNYLSQVHSDLASAVGAVTATVTASDMSDIASRVWATAEGTRVDSRILVIQSNLSDVESAIDAGVSISASDMSDIRSAISAGPAATVTASDISDIASAVWADTIGARVDSRVLVIQSMVSDIDSQVLLNASMISDTYSLLSDHHSDFQSRIPKAVATQSLLSDVNSNLLSYLAGMSGLLSDVESQVDLLATSNYLSQVHSDLASAVGAVTATVSTSDISDIASAVWADTIGARVDSRVLVIQSMVSDVDSQLDLNASMISDVESQLDLNASMISDVDSQLLLNASMISDIESQIDAGVSITASDMSDISSRVWSFGTRTLTMAAASVTAAVSGSDISVLRGDSWSISFTSLGAITGYTSLWFTVKDDKRKADTEAICQITQAGGLLYLNGAAAGTPANGSITVSDAGAGDLTVALDETESAKVSALADGYYDVQVLLSGAVTTLTSGTFIVTTDVTRSTS